MKDKLKGVFIAVGVIAVLVVGGTAIAGATGGDDKEAPDRAITGNSLTKAKAAALAHTGEGRVTDTEVGDEEGAYEVEVTKDDGSQVDVHLDSGFKVLGQVADEEQPGDRDGPGGN